MVWVESKWMRSELGPCRGLWDICMSAQRGVLGATSPAQLPGTGGEVQRQEVGASPTGWGEGDRRWGQEEMRVLSNQDGGQEVPVTAPVIPLCLSLALSFPGTPLSAELVSRAGPGWASSWS